MERLGNEHVALADVAGKPLDVRRIRSISGSSGSVPVSLKTSSNGLLYGNRASAGCEASHSDTQASLPTASAEDLISLKR